MKTNSFLALCGITAATLWGIAHSAFAQKAEDYKSTWKGVASLKTLQKKDGTRDIEAGYPIFSGTRRVAQVAGLVLKNEAIKGFNGFEKESRGTAKDLGLRDGLKYEYQFMPSLVLNRPRFISATVANYAFTGGAHGLGGTTGYVFGYPTGQSRPRQLRLADFFSSGNTARPRINSLLMAKLRATKGQEQEATWVVEGEVKSVTPAQMENFVAEADGLRWFFGPYAMGPYAMGEFEVKLSSRELGPQFKVAVLK